MFFHAIGVFVAGVVYLGAMGFIQTTLEDWLVEKTKWSAPLTRLVSCGTIAMFWWATMFIGAWAAGGV